MGVDGSETRLCEYRCHGAARRDEQLGRRPADAAEVHAGDLRNLSRRPRRAGSPRAKGPGDDIYANNPVNYVKLDTLPTARRPSPSSTRMKRGDYFCHLRRGADSVVRRPGHAAASARSAPTSSGPSRSTSSRWSGATARRPIARSSRRPTCRRSASTLPDSVRCDRQEVGALRGRGTSPATARWCSRSS